MGKIEKCNAFADLLKSFNINFERHNEYHIQVQRIHNFYPSSNTYYNSETNCKGSIPEFKDSNSFLDFLGSNTKPLEADNNIPAFATSCYCGEGFGNEWQEGMSLRDYFAAKAMQYYIPDYEIDFETVAKESYLMADAMLKERSK